MSVIIDSIPKTFQSPTMAPFCKDEEKYQVVEDLVKKFNKFKEEKIKIDNHSISIKGLSFKYEESNEYIFNNWKIR